MPSKEERTPREEEIDAYGLTHPGKVRTVNEDQFLVCSLRKQAVVHQSSLPDAGALASAADRVAFVAMVADGVGGGAAGEEASRLTVEAATAYVSDSMQCYYQTAGHDDDAFAAALQDAAMRCHEGVLARVAEDPSLRGMATTLTSGWAYGRAPTCCTWATRAATCCATARSPSSPATRRWRRSSSTSASSRASRRSPRSSRERCRARSAARRPPPP